MYRVILFLLAFTGCPGDPVAPEPDVLCVADVIVWEGGVADTLPVCF